MYYNIRRIFVTFEFLWTIQVLNYAKCFSSTPKQIIESVLLLTIFSLVSMRLYFICRFVSFIALDLNLSGKCHPFCFWKNAVFHCLRAAWRARDASLIHFYALFMYPPFASTQHAPKNLHLTCGKKFTLFFINVYRVGREVFSFFSISHFGGSSEIWNSSGDTRETLNISKSIKTCVYISL